MAWWDLGILWQSVLFPHSYNKLAAHVLVLRFLPDFLYLWPVILQSAQKFLATQGPIVPYISSHDPSLSHRSDSSAHHVLLIRRICTIVASVLGHTHLAEGNGSYHVVLLPDSRHTIVQARLILVAIGHVLYFSLGVSD